MKIINGESDDLNHVNIPFFACSLDEFEPMTLAFQVSKKIEKKFILKFNNYPDWQLTNPAFT